MQVVASKLAISYYVLRTAYHAAHTAHVTGKPYSAANGSTTKNQTEKIVYMVARQCQWRNLKCQVCDVDRALAPVHEIVEVGPSVTSNPSCDQRGSFTQQQETCRKR